MYKRSGLSAMALAALVGCAGDGGDGGAAGGSDGYHDLSALLPDLEGMFDATYEGTVVDGPLDEDAVTRVECHVAGDDFTVRLEIVSELVCTLVDDDDQVQEAPCTHAQVGNLDVAGQLTIGSAIDVPLTGNAQIGQGVPGAGVGIEVYLEADLEDDVPLQRFSAPCYDGPPYPPFESFSWTRRHSEEDDDPAVWELCVLEVE